MYHGFAEFLYYMALYRELFASQASYWPNIIGAAFGAFLAVLFALVYNYWVEYSRAWQAYKITLAQLQFLLNENRTFVDHNIAALKKIQSLDTTELDKRIVGWITFREFKVNSSILELIRDSQLLNELFDYYIDVSSLNHDMMLIKAFFDDIRKAQFAQQITIANSQDLIESTIKMAGPLINWNNMIAEKSQKLLVRTRVILTKEKKRPIKHLVRAMKPYKITEEDIRDMNKTLEGEMAEVLKKNNEEVIKRLANSDIKPE